MLTAALVGAHGDVGERVREIARVDLECSVGVRWSDVKEAGGALTTGLMNPTGFFPAEMRASLINTSIEASVGVDADVPNTVDWVPSITTS